MTTRKDLINFCLTFPFAYEDYPFGDITVEANPWTVMRHKGNKKSFAFIHKMNGRLAVNLKANPFDSYILRGAFKDIIPAYHMNKEHWNTVYIGGDVPEELLKRLIENSYNLIKPKNKR
jgi:predicted DNA-binding protein (MmcQ/YjbR family)